MQNNDKNEKEELNNNLNDNPYEDEDPFLGDQSFNSIANKIDSSHDILQNADSLGNVRLLE